MFMGKDHRNLDEVDYIWNYRIYSCLLKSRKLKKKSTKIKKDACQKKNGSIRFIKIWIFYILKTPNEVILKEIKLRMKKRKLSFKTST